MTLTHPSPNFGERRGGQQPELVVLHYTAMQGCAAALDRLCDPAAEVSAHYVVDADGMLFSLVDEASRAWHAGAGIWAGRDDINSRSIGVELVNGGNEPFPAAQMDALAILLEGLLARWTLPPQAVIAHSDMAPGRKSDPGARFDWRRLALQGLSVWPSLSVWPTASNPAPELDFADQARRFGYCVDDPKTTLAAFRLRFRPWATGPSDATDAALAADLASRFPVDASPGRA